MKIRVKFQVVELGSGRLTLENVYTEGMLSDGAAQSLLAIIGRARGILADNKQHNGSKVVMLATYIEDILSEKHTTVGILTDAKVLQVKQGLMEALGDRPWPHRSKSSGYAAPGPAIGELTTEYKQARQPTQVPAREGRKP